jgi:hypothetical protein
MLHVTPILSILVNGTKTALKELLWLCGSSINIPVGLQFDLTKNCLHTGVLCQIFIIIRLFTAELWTDRPSPFSFVIFVCCSLVWYGAHHKVGSCIDEIQLSFCLPSRRPLCTHHVESILQLLTKWYWLIGATRSQEADLCTYIVNVIALPEMIWCLDLSTFSNGRSRSFVRKWRYIS